MASITSAPFVGRRQELDVLLGQLFAARQGVGGLALVAGEPGIGKTRLVTELADRARTSGWLVLAGRAYQASGMPPYLPFSDALRAYVATAPLPQLQAQLGVGASEIALIVQEVRKRLPDLAASPALSPEMERYRLFESVAGFLLAVAGGDAEGAADLPAPDQAERSGLVLILDDLHWADPPTLLLLLHLSRRLSGAPALIVCTYRDTEVVSGSTLSDVLASLMREQPGERLLLQGLGAAEIADFAELSAGVRPSPAVVEAIYEETAGNPLFVAELVRLLAQEGRLALIENGPVRQAIVPQSVRQVIGRRLDHLSAGCLGMLTIAAVIGREFDLPVLERAGDLAGDRLLEALEEAEGARVIVAVPGAAGRYGFAHPLMRETLYDQLLTIRRARLHRRAGEALEGFQGTGAEPYLAELAYHFMQAAAGGDVDKAITYARRAADRSMALFAYDDAVAQYQAALNALVLVPGSTGLLRCSLLLALGEAQTRAGSTAAAKASFRSAADIARAHGLAEELARAGVGYGGYRGTPGVVDDYLVGLLDEASVKLGGTVSGLRARVLARLAMELYATEQGERREALSRQAIDVARGAGDRAALAAALVGRHYALHQPESLHDRIAAAAELVQLAEASGDREVALQGYYLRTIDLLELGDPDGVAAAIEAHRQTAAILRQPLYLWRTELLLAMQAMVQGRYAQARELAQRAYATATGAQIVNALQAYGTQMNALCLEAGGLEQLEPSVRQLVGQYPAVVAFRAGLLLLLTRLNRVDEARTELAALAAGGFATLKFDDDWLTTLSCVAEAVADLDAAEHSAALYDLLLPYAERNVTVNAAVGWLGAVARYLGRLATILGRWEAAEEHLECALAMHGRMGARPWTARTQHDLAVMLLRRGGQDDRVRAARLLDEALSVARELGMVYLVERIGALHKRDVSRPPASHRQDDAEPTVVLPDGLTPREVEVLRRLAAGRTNREIAADLVLSVRTVDHHIATIYGKIGARRRADAAAYALRQGLVLEGHGVPR